MLTGVITLASGLSIDVGGIEPPAEADLQQHHVGRVLREQAEGSRGLDLENGDRLAGIGPLAFLQRLAQFVIGDEHAAARAPRRTHSLIRTR